MAAPTAVRTQVTTFLNALWDAIEAGTLFNTAWEHETVEFSVTGRRVVVQAKASNKNGYPMVMITLKRL